MPDKSHPIWTLATIALIGAIGLGYCSIAYSNGVDIIKDGGLVALIGGATALAGKLLNHE